MAASVAVGGSCALWRGWCALGPAVAVAPARRGRLAPRRVLPDDGWQVAPDQAGPGSDSVPARQGCTPVHGGDVWRWAAVAAGTTGTSRLWLA
jgi:hypothetical protein